MAGRIAGATTGVIHTRFGINGLLSGILVMTALYSVNLHVMGKSNVPLLVGADAGHDGGIGGARRSSAPTDLQVLGWEVSTRDARS